VPCDAVPAISGTRDQRHSMPTIRLTTNHPCLPPAPRNIYNATHFSVAYFQFQTTSDRTAR
jgi:hypothetical protein